MTQRKTQCKENGGTHKTCAEEEAYIFPICISEVFESGRFVIRKEVSDIDSLAADIRKRGLIAPLIVREKENGYELVAGHRRLLALKKLKAKECMAKVHRNLSDDDAYEITVAENVQRNDLSSLERALVCASLKMNGHSHQEIARLVFPGIKDTEGRWVRNHLTIASTDERIKDALHKKNIRFYHALLLANCIKSKKGKPYFKDRPDALEMAIAKIIDEELSVRATNQYIEEIKQGICSTGERRKPGARHHKMKHVDFKHHKNGNWTMKVKFNVKMIEGKPEIAIDIKKNLENALEMIEEYTHTE